MYNKEQKEHFLASQKSWRTSNIYTTIFDSAEIVEESLNKDLAEFTREETINFLNYRLTPNVQTAKRDINTVLSYQDYINGTNQMAESVITKDDLDFIAVIKKSFYKDIDEFLNELQIGIGYGDTNYAIPALCLAWLGLEVADSIEVLDDQVDTKHGIITSRGKVFYCTDPRILKILSTYQKTNVGLRTQARTYEVTTLNSGYFLKRMVSKNSKKTPGKIRASSLHQDIQRLRTDVTKIIKHDSKLVYSSVYKSGQLYRAYQLEISGLDVLASTTRAKFHSIFDNKGDYYDYIYLYRKYKEAFNL